MMRVSSRLFSAAAAIVAVAVAAVIALAAPSGAGAATGTSVVHANINHAVIHSGTSATISGSVAPRLPGQLVVLQRNDGGSWHSIARAKLGKASTFTFGVGGSGGQYSYRVVHPVQHGWHTSVSPTKTMTVQTLQTYTVADFTGGRRWDSPRITIPAAGYQVSWTNACVGPENGLVIDWNGDTVNGDSGFEYYYGIDNPARSGVWDGSKGGRSGTFSIAAYCAGWTMHVTYQAWH